MRIIPSNWNVFIRTKPVQLAVILVTHDKFTYRASDGSFKFLPYQLSMVGYWPTMALTGNGELGFDSGEGA